MPKITNTEVYGLGVFGGSDCTFKAVDFGVGNLRH